MYYDKMKYSIYVVVLIQEEKTNEINNVVQSNPPFVDELFCQRLTGWSSLDIALSFVNIFK